ncbi:PREDICTED: keratin, type I cytoskeletal 9-like [Priapulus caudatus]|uniref:Keratin, type I cytoskeletal 9-like n=1 Tax=Priapulus caudatus TaxID=37621 RepID=A0ABM1E2X0_PRICU|nr:PREDICTED: keratin, type I cytoskeletal 9-like [Priapulus caudatus]
MRLLLASVTLCLTVSLCMCGSNGGYGDNGGSNGGYGDNGGSNGGHGNNGGSNGGYGDNGGSNGGYGDNGGSNGGHGNNGGSNGGYGGNGGNNGGYGGDNGRHGGNNGRNSYGLDPSEFSHISGSGYGGGIHDDHSTGLYDTGYGGGVDHAYKEKFGVDHGLVFDFGPIYWPPKKQYYNGGGYGGYGGNRVVSPADGKSKGATFARFSVDGFDFTSIGLFGKGMHGNYGGGKGGVKNSFGSSKGRISHY